MLKLGLMLNYAGRQVSIPMDLVHEVERLGFDSVWVSEAYGSDAVTVATWILARTEKIRVGTGIMQMPARTPAMAAMTAMSLHQLSEGRFIAGLGASGPQVVEGWHGVPYGKPITRTKEYVEIMRRIFARDRPVEFQGEVYQLPAQGPNATGLGKPLKSILGAAPEIPIYTASVTPAGMRAAAEVADGVLPIWMSPEKFDLLRTSLDEGFAHSGRTLENFDVAPAVRVVMGDDLDECRLPVKREMALYVGGMGSRKKNFYNDYCRRMGYGDAAREIQECFLGGDREGAARAVPDALVDETALVGPEERIRERAGAWKAAARRNEVSTVIVSTEQPEVLSILVDCLL